MDVLLLSLRIILFDWRRTDLLSFRIIQLSIHWQNTETFQSFLFLHPPCGIVLCILKRGVFGDGKINRVLPFSFDLGRGKRRLLEKGTEKIIWCKHMLKGNLNWTVVSMLLTWMVVVINKSCYSLRVASKRKDWFVENFHSIGSVFYWGFEGNALGVYW